ncbi:MAG: hypothetical protein B9S32_06845 [Verrucomicrobia bacterium Tous-C9LFEB]|nr:MAG: hypothetical protein B9S32_06845 [Verrucomicrobia bacterium Tous-C9LFEB]
MVTAVLLAPTVVQAQENPNPTATSSQPAENTSGPTVVAVEKKDKDKGENLFRNGDFSDGKNGWRGSGNIIDRDGIKVLEVKLRAAGPHTINGAMKLTTDIVALAFEFDVEGSSDLKPKTPTVIRAYFDQGRTITYTDVRVEPGKKRQVGFVYDVVPGTRDLPLVIEIQPGTGEVYLSNFVAIPRKMK